MTRLNPTPNHPTSTGIAGHSPQPSQEWLRELDTQHQGLGEVFRQLTARIHDIAMRAGSGRSHEEVVHLITDAERLLPAHFEFEEAGGYLSDALAVAPRLSKRAARLCTEHRAFLARFARLAALARAPKPTTREWNQLLVGIRDFGDAMSVHELEENRLIQEAYLDDLGGGG